MGRGDLERPSREELIELVLRLQRPDKTSRTSSKPPSIAPRSGASRPSQAGSGWIDLERGGFYRRGSAERETKKRRPPVQIPRPRLAHMRRWRANGQNYAVEWLGEPVVTGVEKAFARACADAGLDDGVPHTLTRAAATWLVASGTPFETTADFLGMTVETLTRTYRHHAPVLQREVAEAIRRKPKRSTNRSTVANRTTAP